MIDKITTIEALAEMMQRTMASKEDLTQFATKEDLQELRAEMATKEDLQELRAEMATKEDLRILEQKIDVGFQGVNARIDLVREDISDLPAMREELQDLGQRVERVEQKVGLAE